MDQQKTILLVTEGTYPYEGGGVSTWVHQLTNKIKGYDFSIYAMTADVIGESRYELPASIKEVVQLPLWSPEEPFDCMDYNQDYSKILRTKELTSSRNIQKRFVPSFEIFLKASFGNQNKKSVEAVSSAFKQMSIFFETHDYKTTMTSKDVWRCFVDNISLIWSKEDFVKVKMADMTFTIRLLYRFLMPLAITPPKADITHLTLAGSGIIPALRNKFLYDAPIILTEHGVFIRERMLAISKTDFSPFVKRTLILFSEMLTRLTYAEAQKIIMVSKFNITWAIRYGAKKKKIDVIYNGVDHSLFKPDPTISKKISRPTVVAAARIFDLKDILTMIRTCHEVRKKLPNVQFLVYGDCDADLEYTTKCKKLIDEFDLGENFKLAGFHSMPNELYNEGYISILTSISEGFPYTVIESMSCGVPIVATDVGGVKEALNEECGFVCKPRDAVAIAEKVVLLLKNEGLRQQMAIKCRKRVLKHFTIEAFTAKFKSTYDDTFNYNKGKKELSKGEGENSKRKELVA